MTTNQCLSFMLSLLKLFTQPHIFTLKAFLWSCSSEQEITVYLSIRVVWHESYVLQKKSLFLRQLVNMEEVLSNRICRKHFTVTQSSPYGCFYYSIIILLKNHNDCWDSFQLHILQRKTGGTCFMIPQFWYQSSLWCGNTCNIIYITQWSPCDV